MKNLILESKRKLSSQLLIGIGTSLVVVAIAAVSIIYTSLRSNLQEQVQQRALAITYGLEFASEGLIEDKEAFLLERIVQNYSTLPTVLEVSLVDPNGKVLAHSRIMNVGESNLNYGDIHPHLVPYLQQTSQNGKEIDVKTVIDGKSVIVQFLPFSSTVFKKVSQNTSSPQQYHGVAIAVLDLQEIEGGLLRNIIFTILVSTVSTVLIIICIAWLIRRLVLIPLTKIQIAIANSEGNQEIILPALPNNEIGSLATALVSSFEQIKAYRQMELDIAECKYAEVVQRYKLATQSAQVWVWDWDIRNDLFVLECGTQDWFSYDKSQIPNRFDVWLSYIYIDDRDTFQDLLQKNLDGKTSEFACEHRLLDAQGNPHWFLSRGQAVFDNQGKAIRATGTINDIAERKQAEELVRQQAERESLLFKQLQLELKERQHAEALLTETNQRLAISNEDLVRATKMKDEFLANMSHELRTPLNSILGMNEALQDQVFGVVNELQIKALQTVEGSATHLLALINDILDVSKIESGQVTLDLTATGINSLCESSLVFIKQQAHSKRIQVISRIPQYLPQLMLDERRIRQVLINLLNNAVKFTPEGGKITLDVTRILDKDEKTSFLSFAVIDTGIGISAANISKLFQPFIQIDSALNRQYVGTGLGLALVKRIVELHGGQVKLTSELGVGSQFTVELPFNIAEPDLESTSHRELETDDPNQVSDENAVSPLILLADDNKANIITFSSYLEAKGYTMLIANNGQEAIVLAKSRQPALILIDIQMPVLDGLAAMKLMRLDPTLVNTPIVALTALAMAGDREKCLEAGANEYLTKPVRLKTLADTIRNVLKNRN